MASPETPQIEVVHDKDGEEHDVYGFSNTIEASRVIIDGLSDEELLGLIAEIMTETVDYDFRDPEIVFDSRNTTPKEILKAMFAHVVSERLLMIPEVIEREDSNMRQMELHAGFEDSVGE